jgi:hypothetical protein
VAVCPLVVPTTPCCDRTETINVHVDYLPFVLAALLCIAALSLFGCIIFAMKFISRR